MAIAVVRCVHFSPDRGLNELGREPYPCYLHFVPACQPVLGNWVWRATHDPAEDELYQGACYEFFLPRELMVEMRDPDGALRGCGCGCGNWESISLLEAYFHATTKGSHRFECRLQIVQPLWVREADYEALKTAPPILSDFPAGTPRYRPVCFPSTKSSFPGIKGKDVFIKTAEFISIMYPAPRHQAPKPQEQITAPP